MHAVLQLECHSLIHDAIEEFNGSSVVPEHGEEVVVVVTEYNSLAHRQQLFIFHAEVCDPDLVRY